ncbi:hypothetical protein L249_0804 [Ophiocordyceps polyrhachis-furcata BCC 54312]|uniref:Uncharacterized protein n=1 Tax=Ophiocordyceps polyrhachis-furcata BCC 54312 TaxID=1330021 RepID=A0A367LFT2_9HYPO|nr:hypothetical protein L249_0804 [Ophiocordyceps polyrhachis-furcata BCC 54312]
MRRTSLLAVFLHLLSAGDYADAKSAAPRILKTRKITYSCGKLRHPYGLHFSILTDCLGDWRKKKRNLSRLCTPTIVAEIMVSALPSGLHDMLWTQYRLDNVSVIDEMARSLQTVDYSVSMRRALWLKRMTKKGKNVCWPDEPDFTPDDFQEFGGTLAALLVQPVTPANKTVIRRRYQTLPPGFLARNRIHYIYKAAYDYGAVWSMHEDWRHYGIIGLPSYASLQTMRDEFDTWGGRVGRLLMASMRDQYECDYHRGCVDEPRMGRAYQPWDYRALLDLWLHCVSNISPLAFTFGDVQKAPNTLWISL